MKALTVAEFKRQWFLERRKELHARGLKDADIATQMGFKPPYFSQIVGGLNIGDRFIDKMCSAFGLRFPPDPDLSKGQIGNAQLQEEVRLLKDSVNRLLSLHTTLMEAVLKREQERQAQGP